MPSVSGAIDEGAVRVWYTWTSVFNDDATRRRARSWLSADENARLDRFRRRQDQDMFLAGRILARALVGRALEINPMAWGWTTAAQGRPEIVGGGASFNLSHSGGLVMCAIARRGSVGVDVEALERQSSSDDVVARVCAPAEVQDLDRVPRDARQARFLRYWTLKEAYVKARGLGLSANVKEVVFQIDDTDVALETGPSLKDVGANWRFACGQIDHCLYAVAAPVEPSGPRRFELEPMPADVLA